MELTHLPPRPGKKFYLKVAGNYRPNRAWMAVAFLSSVGFLWLLFAGLPQPPPTVTGKTRVQLTQTLRRITNLGRVGCGLIAVISVLGFFHSRRGYSLHIEGGIEGGLAIEGGTEGLGKRDFRAAEGPFRLMLLRRLRDDVPASSVNPDHMHLLAVAEEDDRGDAVLGDYLSTQVAVLDGGGERTVLLSVPEPLPANGKEVFEKLRIEGGGVVTSIRGGGFQLQLPEGPSDS